VRKKTGTMFACKTENPFIRYLVSFLMFVLSLRETKEFFLLLLPFFDG
jgi:hypothetical protein